jgi:hypothetical protein
MMGIASLRPSYVLARADILHPRRNDAKFEVKFFFCALASLGEQFRAFYGLGIVSKI